MKQKLIIDGTTISPKMDGLTQYILNVVVNLEMDALAQYDVKLILNKNSCPHAYLKKIQLKNIAVEYVNIPPIGPRRDFKFWLYALKHTKKNDLFYITSNQWPLCLRRGIYTIHDLIYEQYPEQLGKFSWLKIKYLRFTVRKGLKNATKVVAISNYTKNEIMRCHPKIVELQKKIEVIYEGYEHLKQLSINQITKPFAKYFLYVGSSRGHKNLTNLLQAILLIIKKLPDNFGFAIVGNMSRLGDEQVSLINQVNAHRKTIHLTGWINDEDLAGYFNQATAFVFPSLSEGFGIPVLESFYYNIPLICSNKSALPEVAGDAALYFNPSNPEDIADKLLLFIAKEEIISNGLVAKGTHRLKKFGWNKTAKSVTDLLRTF